MTLVGKKLNKVFTTNGFETTGLNCNVQHVTLTARNSLHLMITVHFYEYDINFITKPPDFCVEMVKEDTGKTDMLYNATH